MQIEPEVAKSIIDNIGALANTCAKGIFSTLAIALPAWFAGLRPAPKKPAKKSRKK